MALSFWCSLQSGENQQFLKKSCKLISKFITPTALNRSNTIMPYCILFLRFCLPSTSFYQRLKKHGLVTDGQTYSLLSNNFLLLPLNQRQGEFKTNNWNTLKSNTQISAKRDNRHLTFSRVHQNRKWWQFKSFYIIKYDCQVNQKYAGMLMTSSMKILDILGLLKLDQGVKHKAHEPGSFYLAHRGTKN